MIHVKVRSQIIAPSPGIVGAVSCEVKSAVELSKCVGDKSPAVTMKLQVQITRFAASPVRIQKATSIRQVQGCPFISCAYTHVKGCIWPECEIVLLFGIPH